MSLSISDLNFSSITLGTWVFGGTSWGGADDTECVRVIHAAIDQGVSCIDTAPIYSHGESERIIGKALAGKRDKIVLATKCGLIRNPDGPGVVHNLNRSEILNQVEGSLRRLKTDYIDLYQCHAPDPDMNSEEVMQTLNQLKDEGKIRAIGVSNFSPKQVEECLRYADVITCQDQYSLLDRRVEEGITDLVRQKNMGILAYGPLAGGVLTGKYKDEPDFGGADCRTFFYQYYKGDAFQKVRQILDELEGLGHPLCELAINWVRQQKGVASVIVGCRTVEQLEKNLVALRWELSTQELEKIDEIINK